MSPSKEKDKNLFDRLYQESLFRAESQSKFDLMRKERELRECTFSPFLSPTSPSKCNFESMTSRNNSKDVFSSLFQDKDLKEMR